MYRHVIFKVLDFICSLGRHDLLESIHSILKSFKLLYINHSSDYIDYWHAQT